MALRSCTTIAAILLKSQSPLRLDKLADEILQSKIAKRAGSRAITWDCEDLVFLDFDRLRIALYEVRETETSPRVICVAVGPVCGTSLPRHIDSASLTHGLVKRMTQFLPARAVLWHDYERPLSAETIDDFDAELDKMLGYLELQMHGTRTPKTTDQRTTAAQAQSRKDTLEDDAALDALRDTLKANGQVREPVSLPLHVSLYVLSATFFFMVPALGTTLLSYVLLRDGVDKPTRSA